MNAQHGEAMQDETLDEMRARLAALLPFHAAFDGWTAAALEACAGEAKVAPDVAQLAFRSPHHNAAVNMIDAWFAQVDAAMLIAVPPTVLHNMKVRARIASLIEARLDILAPHREALRRALSILAFPAHTLTAARLGWRTADTVWRAAGDTATDYNHYTKRMILGSIYTATLLVFLDDESEGQADTRAFLARRIDGVMQFEKAKSQWTAKSDMMFSPVRFLGRLRYP